MKSLNKYIAVSLLGIFIYPIIFQSLHILWHHSHGYKRNHLPEIIEISENKSQPEIKDLSEIHKTCPICEYHFPINDLSKTLLLRTFTPILKRNLRESEIQIQFQPVFSIKSPRAPPLF